MNRSEAAKKRAAEALSKDPEYFAKLAARGKGKAAPNRARPVDKQKAAEGGRNRNKSMAHQHRKQRSIELERKLQHQRETEERRRKAIAAKIAATKAANKLKQHTKHILGEWNENDTTDLDDWQ